VLAELLAAPLMQAVWEATAGDALSEAERAAIKARLDALA
jgi:hypothetical protein